MGDVLSAAARSAVMARVRSKVNLSTEVRLLKLLRAANIKGRHRHLPLAGTPDFASPREKVALFVDRCFWHGCRSCYRKRTSLVRDSPHELGQQQWTWWWQRFWYGLTVACLLVLVGGSFGVYAANDVPVPWSPQENLAIQTWPSGRSFIVRD